MLTQSSNFTIVLHLDISTIIKLVKYFGGKIMEDQFQQIFNEIKQDPMNADYTKRGINPLYYADSEARILIVGQAPGRIAQDTQIVWNDKSGDRLRDWMGVTHDEFYNSGKISVLPMDFYFPGKGKSGDLPPRKGFAAKWHARLIQAMPNLQLTMLVGSYANKYYLHLKSNAKLTDIVHNYKQYLPQYFPLVHPSPRNQLWMSRNPWFEKEVLPDLKQRIDDILR